ncbi:MAG: hypothetical protein A3C93_01555 [Candidatus Lloydbacteria bacterium RIFCSPHIGHO2_02_FULL_54_17]|uniref:Uncharacterized protein n=1 Tax=Candidatus Lloydbacteria bacterium RIFCSPHIGHO2_02_FULL_54_17 TaxID=1798664 RepID=A0A1G2DBL3_9BACT|nr:MAG: hypothetical protein A2762_00485 [Candidatus Lloydbacteria bacterium RIFCSPHIGHO2_01_FULL_54_11]OGZ11015.1 MAG: hypothetical protein A3C93_01555 [Candidatus Lloydbacteria bacterium RIFCSPHIGHO2_02_FULL_54_17]OGZ13166.1 MAG: hypothetical protein A2948_02250 [Candidatus Lloydbacteria bacterium RIFCSPLOWO2_01_FULL_54_18]OGZ15507.1 MAG: hypothetical protein A3H76_00330 [Candidatus Lloydbacteria bacterium RIFCSPLOWO2_02_FULL_54_12]
METNDRKEVIQLNGLTILVVMALVADFLIVGLMYRWHGHQIFADEKKYNGEYTELLEREHGIKNEIVALEGATTWNETAYVKSTGKNLNVAQ